MKRELLNFILSACYTGLALFWVIAGFYTGAIRSLFSSARYPMREQPVKFFTVLIVYLGIVALFGHDTFTAAIKLSEGYRAYPFGQPTPLARRG